MAELFGVNIPAISKHLTNIYEKGELLPEATVSKMEIVQTEGNRQVKRNVDFYNLDAIISVGYRVNSRQATKFRIWATGVLKEYMIKGYTVNKKRLEYLEKTVQLIDIANRGSERINGDEAKDILNVINNYSKALDLLDDYDHKKIKKSKGNIDELIITYDECIKVINKLLP